MLTWYLLNFKQVRQLEAIVRISESLAKMRLAPFAGHPEVDEALRLFQVPLFYYFDYGISFLNKIHMKVDVSSSLMESFH